MFSGSICYSDFVFDGNIIRIAIANLEMLKRQTMYVEREKIPMIITTFGVTDKIKSIAYQNFVKFVLYH